MLVLCITQLQYNHDIIFHKKYKTHSNCFGYKYMINHQMFTIKKMTTFPYVVCFGTGFNGLCWFPSSPT